ncbi:MAG: hypothetical protein MST12_00750 [Spirochaetia bacterium]|nr:hypothetical protein [Spirochaetia bacterium]
MASTIKLQDSTQNSVSNLISSLTTNTAKEKAQAEKEVIQSVKARSAQGLDSPVYQTEKNHQSGIKTVTTDSAELDLTKVGVCFNVPKYIKDMWKTYFTTHGLTMTDGLIQAVNYLKEQEEKGEVKLGAISILKN